MFQNVKNQKENSKKEWEEAWQFGRKLSVFFPFYKGDIF